MMKFRSASSIAVVHDITPKITKVLFENIGEEVVAKIEGSSMWFVHNVSIDGLINSNGKDLKVDLLKSTESEVQTRMGVANIRNKDSVCVRVKTHFQNSKYLQAFRVPAKESVRIFLIFINNYICVINLIILEATILISVTAIKRGKSVFYLQILAILAFDKPLLTPDTCSTSCFWCPHCFPLLPTAVIIRTQLAFCS